MSSNNVFKSDLEKIHYITQNSMIVYPKELIISTLRDYFSKDSYYHYSKDAFGFANTTNHTDMPLGSDLPYGPGANPQLSLTSILSTRLFIGENYRQDGIFYPAILIRNAGSKYVPISINRNIDTIEYEDLAYEDGYGHISYIRNPKYYVTNGAWEGSITIDVVTRSLRSRDDIVELIALALTDIYFDSLVDVGLTIKPITIGSPTETDDRNDKLFRQTITLDIRSEWERKIPIKTLIDVIFFTIEFKDFTNPNAVAAKNLTIKTEVNLTDMILEEL